MAAALEELHTAPVGGAATSVYAGKIDVYDENELTRGDRWRGSPERQGEAQKMLTSSHVRAARDTVIDPVVGGEWDVEPGGRRPVDKEAAALARWVLLERFPWSRSVRDIMRAYMSDGFAVVEKTEALVPIPTDRFPLHPGRGRGVALQGLTVRPGWSILDWRQKDEDGTQVAYVRQWLNGSDAEEPGWVEIPSDRFLRFTWEQDGANFEGFAPQRSAFGPWFVMRLLTRIEAQSHERNHMATPIAEQTEQTAGGDDDEKKLAKIFAAYRANAKGHIVLPYGYTLHWSQHGQQTNIAATIKECKFDIAHNYLGGFMLLGTSTGSHALAGTQKGQFDLGIYKHAYFLRDVFNFGLDGWSLIERIVRLNYGADVAIPRLVVRYLPTVDFTKTLPILATMRGQKLVRGGRPSFDAELERFVLRGLNAPTPDPDEPFVETPAEGAELVEPVVETPAEPTNAEDGAPAPEDDKVDVEEEMDQ